MPIASTIATVAAIASLAGTGISVGETLANQPGSSTPKPPTQAQNDTSAAATRKSQEASLSSQFPNLQAQVGGALSPDAYVQLAQILSGQAGQPGIGASSSDLITKLAGNNSNTSISAGSGGTGGGGGVAGLSSTSFG